MSKTDATTSAPKCKPKRLDSEGLYGREEIMSIFTISKETLKSWTDNGLRPLYKGKTHLFDGGEIRAFLRQLRDEKEN